MKKIMFTAGLALAVTTGAALVAQVQAAPAKDPMCSVGPQSGSVSWQEHYRCWSSAPMVTHVRATRPAKKDPMCSLGSQSGSQSWAAYYHCW